MEAGRRGSFRDVVTVTPLNEASESSEIEIDCVEGKVIDWAV
jgi:hypothetical protein